VINKIITSTRFSLLSFRRNPAATFFTIIFPMMFLLLFGLFFGSETSSDGSEVITFIVPGIMGMSLVGATFVNQAMNAVNERETGQLKRLRSTPLPPFAWIVAQIISSFAIVIVMAVLVTVAGRLIFDVTFNLSTVGVFAVSLFLGTMAFSALGLAVTAVIPNMDAAPAVTNLIVLPLYFVSDVFFFSDESPGIIEFIGNLFPVKHLVAAFQDSYNPFVESVAIPWGHWAVIAGWGVAGVVLATRYFRWTPSSG